MSSILSVVSAVFWGILVLSVLVFVHEGGHYLAARAFHVRVTEFFLGMGPIGLPEDVRVCADASLRDSLWWTIGANECGYHYVHARLGRDFELDDWVDVITVKEGDGCPTCGEPA